MEALHLQLRIDREGTESRDHHFWVADLSEVAGYVHNAMARFFHDHPEASPVDAPITLRLGKGDLSGA